VTIPLAQHRVRPEDIDTVVEVLKSDRLSLGPKRERSLGVRRSVRPRKARQEDPGVASPQSFALLS
jgi:hypothetical protein